MHIQLAFFFLLLGLTSTAGLEPTRTTGEAPDPKVIVQKAAEAIGKLKVAAYDLDYKVSGFFAAFFPNMSGRVLIGKESPDGTKRFRCNLKVQRGESSEVTEVSAGADGTTYYLIDDKTRTVYADIDPQVLGKHRDGIEAALVRELGMARPFEDALKGGEFRYERDETVDGHDCHVVFFKSALTAPAMEWYFSKKDFLPRRVRFSMKDPQAGEGAADAIFRSLAVNPKLDKDPFALVVPPEYKKTDDFSP